MKRRLVLLDAGKMSLPANVSKIHDQQRKQCAACGTLFPVQISSNQYCSNCKARSEEIEHIEKAADAQRRRKRNDNQ